MELLQCKFCQQYWRFFDEEGGFFKCGNFEQNGGSHDMSRALGNARNSVTLGLLGDIVRMSTGANALQLMGLCERPAADVNTFAQELDRRHRAMLATMHGAAVEADLPSQQQAAMEEASTTVASMKSTQFRRRRRKVYLQQNERGRPMGPADSAHSAAAACEAPRRAAS